MKSVMAKRKIAKKSGVIKMSMAFKKAVAAAAMSKLMEGIHNEESAARSVITQVGDLIFPTKKIKDAAEALIKFRHGVRSEEGGKGKIVSLARFHYFHCLLLINSHRLGPKQSADLLLKTVLTGVRKSGK